MNQDNQQANIPRSAREQTKKLKKIIVITFCIMVAFVLVYFIFSAFLYDSISQTLIGYFPWIEDILNDGAGDEYHGKDFSNYFEPVDYEYNIMEDKEYLGLDRNVYYYASSDQYGSVIVLDEDNYDKQAMGVTLLYDMIGAIIAGDVDTYNACFSDYYFEHKGIEPDPGFTMTQLYDIKITNMGQKKVSDKKLGNYTQYEFVLQYSIRKSNGTFRSDIGSDENAANYIVITDRCGELLIEDTHFPYFFSH